MLRKSAASQVRDCFGTSVEYKLQIKIKLISITFTLASKLQQKLQSLMENVVILQKSVKLSRETLELGGKS